MQNEEHLVYYAPSIEMFMWISMFSFKNFTVITHLKIFICDSYNQLADYLATI